MSLLTHLVIADVRRHRLVLAVWLFIVVATAIVDGARPLLGADPAVRAVGILGSLLWLAYLLLMIVLIPLVVQTHPLVGSTAFWMTRPIPPRTLLVSKAVLLAVVMIAAPMLAEAVLMAAYYVPLAQIAAVAAQTALSQTFWMILLMTAAALTPNLTRFALVCGGALVALALLLAATLAISMATMEDSPPMSGGGDTGEPTSGFVLTVLAVVAGVALIVVQYRSRSRVRSVPVGASCLFLAFFAASAWPWPMLAPRLDVPAWVAAESTLRLSASAETVQVQVNERMSPFSRRTEWRLARARVWLAGIEPKWSADVRVLEAALHLDGGTRLASAGSGYPSATPIEGNEERPTRGVLRHLLGVERLVDFHPPRGESAVVFFLRDSDFRKLAPATGTYRGRFQVRLTHHDLEATLPLQRGATHQNGAYRFIVEGVERTSASVSILARESDATSLFDRRPTSELSFYLRNRRASEAVVGSAHDPGEGFFLARFLPFVYAVGRTSGFSARNLLVQFPPGYRVEGESFSIDDDWFKGAELVIVRAIHEGSVERPLEIAGFPLRAGSESTPSAPGK